MPEQLDVGIEGTSVLDSVQEINRNQWNNVVKQSNHGTMFHRHEWLAAIEAGFDKEPCHAVVQKGDNPVAVLPNFVSQLDLPVATADSIASILDISVMTSTSPGYGGPLVLTDEEENINRLWDAVEAVDGQRILYHDVRSFDQEFIRYGQYLEARGYGLVSDACLFVLDLGDGWETILERMDKERRKALRQAHDQEFEVEMWPLGEDLDRTYNYYAENMERVEGETFPRSYFEALAGEVSDRVRVFAATVDGEEVGRYVHLLDEESSVLHHWLSAIPDESCFERYPSELLHARAIKWGIEKGYDRYSFGLTGSHFENSVFRFKSKYGGQAVPLLRWRKGNPHLGWHIYKYGRSRYLKENVR